jgi:hypothetical protein
LKAEAYVELAQADSEAEVPQTLYHTLLTVVDHTSLAPGAPRAVYPLGTHTTLEAAKKFSLNALSLLGYSRSDFELYEEKPAKTDEGDESPSWHYGDGTLVHAVRTGPHDFLISLAVTPNNEGLPASRDQHAHLELPDGSDHLHYVLQTCADLNADRSGEAQSTEVEGVFAHRKDAFAAAKNCLVSDEVAQSDFAQYDEWDEDELKDEWPFGEDVVVHAVAQTGENYVVAVRTVPGSHAKHGKNARKHH